MKRIFKGVSITTVVLSICFPSMVEAVSSDRNTASDYVPINTELLSQNFDYKDFNFWANQCRVLAREQNYTEALAACERAIALRPKSRNAEIWALRSEALLQLKRYAEAIASYDFLLQRVPKDSLAWTRRCEALYQLGKYEDALASCSQALLVNGNWGTGTPALAWYNKGLALRKLGQNETALESFDRVLAIDSSNSLALVERCGTLTDLERYEEALASCEQAKQAVPVLALTNAAQAQQKAGQLESAIATYDQLLALSPNNATAWTRQGTLFEKFGQTEKAMDSYNRAIQINPKSSFAQVNRCTLLNQLEKYTEALAACDNAIAGDGIWGDRNPAYSWNQRSSALIGLKQYQDALTSAERAININDKFAEAWNNKGVILWYLEKYQDAQIAIQKAVDIAPTYSQAWFNQGRIFSTLKQYPPAIEAYEKALLSQINTIENISCVDILYNPNNQNLGELKPAENILEAAKKSCAEILANKSVASWNLRDYENALKSANQAIQLNPKSFEAWYNQGVVLLDLGQYSEALDAYDQADKLNPHNFQILTAKGLALQGMGENQKALEAFEAALNINPNYQPAQQYRDLLLEKFKTQT